MYHLFLKIIYSEPPSIEMVGCSDFVEEGNIFICTCKRNDTSDIPTVVYWFNAQTTGEKMAVLSDTAIENKTGNFFQWIAIFNIPKLGF